jgi:glutamate dehydrogenase/leucine dehydrogenase
LKENDIYVIPDVLCNSGGVVVSYYEWLQNRSYEQWSYERVHDHLLKRMTETFHKVIKYAQTQNSTYREAAFKIALENLSVFA